MVSYDDMVSCIRVGYHDDDDDDGICTCGMGDCGIVVVVLLVVLVDVVVDVVVEVNRVDCCCGCCGMIFVGVGILWCW